jgi:3-hydroxyacyl-CoA dehydrogenase/enoyl-CoA hydratase/3-hydroxybutyryl-CoA epimerase
MTTALRPTPVPTAAPAEERLHAALTLRIADGIAVATFDLPGAPVNVLGAAAGEAFGALLDRLDRDASIRACVLRSGKRDGWIAGADIDQFAGIHTAADGEALSREGQAMADRVERCRVPVVAAVHGACLGGGLEVALACAWRVASEHPKTTFALPEVQLGLIPGMGGTQRLPQRIGLQAALDLILTGRTVRAKKALALGIVDDLVHPAALDAVALERARELAAGTRARGGRARPRTAGTLLLDDNPLGRTVVFSKAREQALKKTRGHYPAPPAALDAVHEGFAHGRAAGLAEEARRFGQLAVSAVSRELVGLFHATTALKKPDAALPAPRRVETLAVVGAGFMGAGIAAVAARRGTPVRLKDADVARVARGVAAVDAVLGEALARRRVTRLEHARQRALVTATADWTGMRRADLVIEAVFEDLALKRQVLAEAERAAPDAVLATNTSTIPVAEIAEGAARPERVVGMHFFSPVQKMPLLEVVRAPRSAPEALSTAVAYGRALGKTVIVVGDGPGLLRQPDPRAVPQRGRVAPDRGRADRADRRGARGVGVPGGAVPAHGRGGARRGGQGRRGGGGGLRRAPGPRARAPARAGERPRRAGGPAGLLPLRRGRQAPGCRPGGLRRRRGHPGPAGRGGRGSRRRRGGHRGRGRPALRLPDARRGGAVPGGRRAGLRARR